MTVTLISKVNTFPRVLKSIMDIPHMTTQHNKQQEERIYEQDHALKALQ